MLSSSNRALGEKHREGNFGETQVRVLRRLEFIVIPEAPEELLPNSKSGTLSPKPSSWVHSFCVPSEKLK